MIEYSVDNEEFKDIGQLKLISSEAKAGLSELQNKGWKIVIKFHHYDEMSYYLLGFPKNPELTEAQKKIKELEEELARLKNENNG